MIVTSLLLDFLLILPIILIDFAAQSVVLLIADDMSRVWIAGWEQGGSSCGHIPSPSSYSSHVATLHVFEYLLDSGELSNHVTAEVPFDQVSDSLPFPSSYPLHNLPSSS